jgi:arsenical-resistance protein 2
MSLGSSRGRGTRAAGWFDDLIKSKDVSTVKSVILEGGIAGWAKAGEEYTALMDEYNAEFWT